MRRPPDKDGQASLSERDVDSSNATLHTLFGARQKPWMVGRGTIRPTPRDTSLSKSSKPQATPMQRGNAAVLPSPVPSNDFRPVITNDTINRRTQDSHQGGSNGRSTLSAILNDPASFPEPSPVEAGDGTMEEFSPTREEIQIESPLQLPRDQATPRTNGVDLPYVSSSDQQSPIPLVLLSPEMQSNTILLPSRTVRHTSLDATQNQGNSNRPPVSGLDFAESPVHIQGPEHQFNNGQSPFQYPAENNPSNPTSLHGTTLPAPRRPTETYHPSTPIETSASSTTGPQSTVWPSSILPNGPNQLPNPIQRDHQGAAQSASRPNNPNKSPAPIQTTGSSTAGPQNRALPPPGLPTGHPPPKLQRTQLAPIPSLRPRIASIEAHLNSVGGEDTLNMYLERPRFQLLMEACTKEDAFYVALHQIFIVWETDRKEILRIQGFPDQNILNAAFQTITTLIKENDALAPNHKIWFAGFPSPLSNLLRTSDFYRKTVADVGVFLDKLARTWLSLTQECARRGYPVLVDELVNKLGLLSTILQGVVFTATRRNIGIPDELNLGRMDELYKKDQYEYQRLAARYNNSDPSAAKELFAWNEALAKKYITLRNQLIQQRQAPASMMGSNPASAVTTPTISNNTYVQNGVSKGTPVVSRPEQHAVSQQPSRIQNVQSPDLSGNWQFIHAPVRTSSSPNPSIIPGRPASIGPHQLHGNSLSTTLFQGLSMHSPVQQNFQFGPTLRSTNGSVQSNQFSAGPNPSVTYYSSPFQNGQPFQQAHYAVQQPQQHAITTQIPQQQQQRQQDLGTQQQQFAAQHNAAAHQQSQVSAQQIQWQYQMQEQMLRQAQQQTIQQQAIQQQIQGNRAAQLRRDPSIPVDPQRGHSRTSSISSNGRRTPSTNTNSQLPPHNPARATPLPPDRDEEGIITYSRTALAQRPLVPPLGFLLERPPNGHNGEVNALHQALLRSPYLNAAEFVSSERTQNDPAFRYYQAVRSLALGPVKLSSSPISKFEFKIPQSDHAYIPKDSSFSNTGQPPIREFRRGTLQYRIRCVKMDKSVVECSFSDWVVADTVWPESACLEMNTEQLELRRKSHHSKDLPIDVTALARKQGVTSSNRITFSVTRNRKELKENSFFLGVDVVEILGHRQILDICQENRLPATDTLNKIKKSLAPPPSDDDDDFAMVVSDISIDLTDPWMSKIFNIPVRGSSCLHRECFDLETFLLTRNSKPKRPQQPCIVDTWKCPLCSRDARPRALRIDEFLVDVRASLAMQGKLDVRAIWVSADGTWRPKIEKRKTAGDGDESDYSSDGDGATRRKTQKLAKANVGVQVIALDDD